MFNTPDARTARLFSDSLGLTDIIEHRETISFGADVTRDGNSLNAQRVERPIVTASEIQSLPQFRAYIRFGYDAPTALVQFPPISTPEIAPAIVKYEGNGFAIGAMDEVGQENGVGQAGGASAGDLDGGQDAYDEEETREEGAAVADRGSRPVGAGSSKGTVGRGSSVAATAMERDVDQPFKLIPPRDKLAAFEAWFTERKRPRFDRQAFTEIPGLREADRALAWEVWYRAKMMGHEVPQTILFLALDGLVTNHKGRGPDRVIQVPDYYQFVAILPAAATAPTAQPVASAEARPGKRRGKAAPAAPIGAVASTPGAAFAPEDQASRPTSKGTKPEPATIADANQLNFALGPPVDKGKRLTKRITAAKAGL